MLFAGPVISVAWYYGYLADFYADYPVRQPLPTIMPNTHPAIIAHRGASLLAPENTLPAIRAAIELGAQYVELDMRLTADGVPVLMHDRTVDRTTDGVGSLEKLTYAEVQTLDAGSWFSNDFRGTRVPTLEEALHEIRGKTCLIAHIKENINLRLIRLLQSFAQDFSPPCLLIVLVSYVQPDLFYDLADNDEEKKYVDFYTKQYRRLNRAQTMAFARYWPDFPSVTSFRPGDSVDALLMENPGLQALEIPMPGVDRVMAAHAKGLFTYTRIDIRVENAFENALDAGVDGIFFDDIAGLQEFLKEFRSTERSATLPPD